MNRLIATTTVSLLLIGTAFAQQPAPMPGKDMGPAMNMGMDMKMMPDTKDTPSTAAYKSMMTTQMKSMPAFSGNGDTDYMTHMRHHHQAAIEMSKLVIAGTKDTAIKKLAQDIIAAQEKEITVIDAWLKKKPG